MTLAAARVKWVITAQVNTQDTMQVTGQVTDQVAGQVTDQFETLIEISRHPRSADVFILTKAPFADKVVSYFQNFVSTLCLLTKF